nr:gdsl esterase/lipase [Quercus suber]
MFAKATNALQNTSPFHVGRKFMDRETLAAGLPFLPPYLDQDVSVICNHGENFAVAGATALPPDVLAKRNISFSPTKYNLNVQLDCMSTYFNGICHNAEDRAKKLKTALFMIGEIGGNDYNFAFLQGKTIEEVRDMVPEVVQAIKDAVTRVIGYGATRVVVLGNLPIGCLPICLAIFQTNNSAAYVEFHCLKELNSFSMYHNDQLKQALEDLRKENPNVIVLMDRI